MSYTQSINVSQQNEKSFFRAKSFSLDERRQLAVKAISNEESVTDLAKESGVSRKFVYAQKNKAIEALNEAFGPDERDDTVLFTVPMTQNLIRASVVSLALNCHGSERGIVQHFRDLYNYNISEATVHNTLAGVAQKAAILNKEFDLKNVKIAAHDEIFQGLAPILVGCDARSGFVYLLSKEPNRDGVTWGLDLLECQENGLNPDQVIADGGTGLRAGIEAVWPNLPCDADVFHVLMDLGKIQTYLENRAMGAIANVYRLEKQWLQLQKQMQNLSGRLEKIQNKKIVSDAASAQLVQLNIFNYPGANSIENNLSESSEKTLELEGTIMNIQNQQNVLSQALFFARTAEKNIIRLVDIIEIIKSWLQHDILAVAGPNYAARCELFDFVVQELLKAEKECPSKHVRKIIYKLKKQRDDLLRFALRIDSEIALIAKNLNIEESLIRELFELQGIPYENNHHWVQKQKLREKIGQHFHLAIPQVNRIMEETVRASSIVENVNSRLRTYFFLRKSFGQESLDLLQLYLNHKTFLRSEHPERIDKSPAELLSGQAQVHWLEMLGFKRFKQPVAKA